MNQSILQYFDRLSLEWNSKYAPSGGMLPRVQRFLNALHKQTPVPSDILDFGCGSGQISRACGLAGYRVYGVDASPLMIEVAEKSNNDRLVKFSHLIESDPLRIPFPKASFDAIIASSVLEYVSSPEECFAELRRISRPNGLLLLTVPNNSHFVRRLESVSRPLARFRWPFLNQAGKNWQEYLTLSNQRHSLTVWSQQLESSGWKIISYEGEGYPLCMIIAQRSTLIGKASDSPKVTPDLRF